MEMVKARNESQNAPYQTQPARSKPFDYCEELLRIYLPTDKKLYYNSKICQELKGLIVEKYKDEMVQSLVMHRYEEILKYNDFAEVMVEDVRRNLLYYAIPTIEIKETWREIDRDEMIRFHEIGRCGACFRLITGNWKRCRKCPGYDECDECYQKKQVEVRITSISKINDEGSSSSHQYGSKRMGNHETR
jgi:hypothetical protein